MPLRVVPAYTLAVEPKQAIEITGKPRKPFDVLLRVHSYATQPGEVRAGLTVPRGWKTGAPVPLKFEGAGDRYARLTVTPPLKLGRGNFKISAYVERAANRARGDKAEKFSTSLEPLSTLPTQLWSEPAQCAVHVFDVLVPANLRVGYITAEANRSRKRCSAWAFAWRCWTLWPWPSAIYPHSTPSSLECAHTSFGRNCLERISGYWITSPRAERSSCNTSASLPGTNFTMRRIPL